MLNLLFGVIGLLVGGLINLLADDLPHRERPSLLPHCPNPECDHVYGPAGWLAVARRLADGERCPQCGQPPRRRPLLVEVGTALLFAALPTLLTQPLTLAVYALYIAALLLIIVIDLENRLILDVVTLPGTAVALLFSLILPGINLISAALGAVLGFVLFLGIYWLAKVTFGPGAIGQGDVKLALLMGAMLGVPHILIALMIGILLGGFVSGLLLATRLVKRSTYLPYGQYLAAAAIIMLLWGQQITNWLLG
ncbi:MAG: prepilin peptidase [Chloroflexi bacterium]|nr:prepilin peptidase [Chloroflexota bacterium]